MAFVAKKASTGEVDEGKMRLSHHFFCLTNYTASASTASTASPHYKDMAIVCVVDQDHWICLSSANFLSYHLVS